VWKSAPEKMKLHKNEPTDSQTDFCGSFRSTSRLTLHRKRDGKRPRNRPRVEEMNLGENETVQERNNGFANRFLLAVL